MITFDRQAAPLQNFNRSHVMVIGRSVSFSDPTRPPGGGVGRPKHPPPQFFIFFCLRFKTQGRCFWKTNSVTNPPPPLISPLLIIWCSDQYTYMSCPLTIYNHGRAGHMHIYAYNTLGYHHLFRWQTLLIIDYMMQWPIYLHELCACMCLSW